MGNLPGGAHLVDILWGLLLTLAGFIVKNERDERKQLEKRVDEMPRTFASKDDIKDIKEQVGKTNDKLDRLIERDYAGHRFRGGVP